MIAVRIYTEAELKKRLAPYKCRKIGDVDPLTEIWETGWGSAFTLSKERGDRYDEWQYRQFLVFIASSMPQDWFNGSDK